MGTENVESREFRPSSHDHNVTLPPRAELIDKPEHEPTDVQALVEKLVAAGRWPAPALLHQIVNAGDAAVEPLRAVLRTDPRGWPAKAPLVHAIRLVSTLRPPAAIPELVSIIRRYMDKLEEEAVEALSRFGTPGFDALIELYGDPSIRGYRRVDVGMAAKLAAGDDPVKKARVAELLRSTLEQLIANAREMDLPKEPVDLAEDNEEFHGGNSNGLIDVEDNDVIDDNLPDEEAELDENWDEDEDLEEEDDWDEDEELYDDKELDEDALLEDDENWGEDDDFEGNEHELASDIGVELAFVVCDLADLADPLAVDLIKTAFEEELVDTSFMDQEEIDEQYRRGGITPGAKADWLESYQKSYDKHIEAIEPSALPPPINVRRPRYRYEDRYDEGDPPPDTPATAPILNTEPRLGRNDPCWCGSGKKYKRCHLGKGPLG